MPRHASRGRVWDPGEGALVWDPYIAGTIAKEVDVAMQLKVGYPERGRHSPLNRTVDCAVRSTVVEKCGGIVGAQVQIGGCVHNTAANLCTTRTRRSSLRS
eukprot:scaffold884_cov398-Prasinococcus_capsulatus_cf.AAC.6